MYQRRTHSKGKFCYLFPSPSHIHKSNLQEVFDPIVNLLEEERKDRQVSDKHSHVHELLGQPMTRTNLKEQMSQVGTVVKIKWTEDEIGDSGWKPGW